MSGYLDWWAYVKHDARYERPAEADLLVGDPEKARRVLMGHNVVQGILPLDGRSRS